MEHAGQFLFPAELVQARTDYSEGKISYDALRNVEDACIKDVVKNQVDLGRAITGGELRRQAWPVSFLAGFSGIEGKVVRSGHVYQDVEVGELSPEITGEIAFSEDHPIFADFAYLASLLDSPSKARITMPAPATAFLYLLHSANYTNPEALASKISEAYHSTLIRLYEMGCRSVLMRDVSWHSLCYPDRMTRLIQGGMDPAWLLDTLTRVNETALEGFDGKIERILFVTTNYLERDDTSVETFLSVVKALLAHKNIDVFMTGMVSLSAFTTVSDIHFPEDKGLIVGMVDAASPALEDKDTLARTIRRIAAELHPASLGVSPADGFFNNDDTFDTSAFTEPDQWRKLQLLAEAAKEIEN